MKRILALAAALCLCAGLAVTALAEDVDFTMTPSELFVQQGENEFVNRVYHQLSGMDGERQFTAIYAEDEMQEKLQEHTTNPQILSDTIIGTVTVRLLQYPRDDTFEDPYSEEARQDLLDKFPADGQPGMWMTSLKDNTVLCTLGTSEYRAVMTDAYYLPDGVQQGEPLKVRQYRMYSDSMVYEIDVSGSSADVAAMWLLKASDDFFVSDLQFDDGITVPVGLEDPQEPEVEAPEEETAPQTVSGAKRSGFSLSSALGKTLMAMIIGALAAGIPSFLQYQTFQSVLRQCETFAQDADAFEYKGKHYNRSKYIELRAPQWSSLSKKQLAQAIEKQTRKAKTPLAEADLAAMRVAYERKAE